ncbi:MAG: kinase/pyrophosphorylase [Gracilibacteraceae bacterium]|jgi:regulator of PEP synthase PpsR (kinase-PPPase family)|nr:kinase/pyrophosphorylase [Gracilibacteraceae bacterium]
MSDIPVVYVISDALGETAELVYKAAAAQFDLSHSEFRRNSYVQTEAHIDEIIDEAASVDAILIYTMVMNPLRVYLDRRAREKNLVAIDILSPLISALSTKLGMAPQSVPNITHRVDEQYFRKIEAVEFAVKYDDGKDPRGALYADVVLIGVSRTSKTPLSMYLAHKGVKTANIPLVPEVAPPRELFLASPQNVFGLVLSPEKLNSIRSERLKSMGMDMSSNYAKYNRIVEELEYAENTMKRIGCMVIDTTNKAVEETAGIILQTVYKRQDIKKT